MPSPPCMPTSAALAGMSLQNVMTREVVAVEADASLEQVWELLRRHRIRGVPVVDRDKKLIGIVTIADFLKQADWRMCDSLKKRLKILLSRTPKSQVRDIMTSPALGEPYETGMAEAFLIFAENGINHLPVVDDDNGWPASSRAWICWPRCMAIEPAPDGRHT